MNRVIALSALQIALIFYVAWSALTFCFLDTPALATIGALGNLLPVSLLIAGLYVHLGASQRTLRARDDALWRQLSAPGDTT